MYIFTSSSTCVFKIALREEGNATIALIDILFPFLLLL